MGWNNDERILWYGERGIVNAVATHIANGSGYVQKVKEFLLAIKWADGNTPSWINEVVDARLVIEMGLADFGDPDLVLVCKTGLADGPYCVFIEAKATCYQQSMAGNSQMMTPGYNSSINGQLSLKYRFAKALENSNSSTNDIVEPQALFSHYKKQLGDYGKRQRHLQKGKIVEVLADLGLIGLPESRCHYVAWTWDIEPEHIFFKDRQVKNPDNLPLFLEEKNGASQFNNMLSRVGWLGYKGLENRLALHLNPEYEHACKSMFKGSEPEERHYEHLMGLEDLPDDTSQLVQRILELMKGSCPGRELSVRPFASSWSIGIGTQTLVKVIPAPPKVFVGIRLDGKSMRTVFPEHRSVQGVEFWGGIFDPETIDLDQDSVMKDILLELAGQCQF